LDLSKQNFTTKLGKLADAAAAAHRSESRYFLCIRGRQDTNCTQIKENKKFPRPCSHFRSCEWPMANIPSKLAT